MIIAIWGLCGLSFGVGWILRGLLAERWERRDDVKGHQ